MHRCAPVLGIAVVAMLAACASDTEAQAAGEQQTLPAQLCHEAPCAGTYSKVIVYRTPSGEPAIYLHAGDLQACSHPPYVYFDAEGNRVLNVAERPIRDEADAQQLDAQRESVVGGLVLGETINCSSLR